jgi:hypothetical protein
VDCAALALHPPSALLESSHVVLDPSGSSRRLHITRLLLQCGLLCIIGLRILQTEPAVHGTRSLSDWLGAAVLLAALAPTMRPAALRAASSSSLGAAQVLAAPAATMRRAGTRVASSRLGAALLLAPLASAVRDTVLRAATSSCLGAAQVLAAPSATMRHAGTRVALCGLGAALFLAPLDPAVRDTMLRAYSQRTQRRVPALCNCGEHSQGDSAGWEPRQCT